MFAALGNWIKAPFAQPLDMLHLFLVVGAVMVFAIVWSIILHKYVFEE